MRTHLALLVVAAIAAACSAGGRRNVGTDDATVTTLDASTSQPPDGGSFGPETCGNGLDDNGDGFIDENCDCTEGERQGCWPLGASRRGIGACRDGVQVCEPYVEFRAWSACTNPVLPQPEIPNNGIDEDCDGGDEGGRTCLSSEFGEGCGGGVDDDCDGLVDCDDPDCAPTPACASSCVPNEFGELCTDSIDNDCDGRTDCLDNDCASSSICTPPPPPPPPPGCTPQFPFIAEILCGDGRDNDCDGNIDCADSDCERPGSCGCANREDACGDGMDNDCDESTDCEDLDCQACTPGQQRWCDDPMYCHWGRQECGSDGRWGTCVEVSAGPSGCSGSLYSASCCVSAGGCCQNYPENDESIGNCAGIVSCRP